MGEQGKDHDINLSVSKTLIIPSKKLPRCNSRKIMAFMIICRNYPLVMDVVISVSGGFTGRMRVAGVSSSMSSGSASSGDISISTKIPTLVSIALFSVCD
jgi:hypothetical protein